MSRAGVPAKKASKMSKYESKYARALYSRGYTFKQIAEVTGYSKNHIHRLKNYEGDWEEHRLPKFGDLDVLLNLKEILFRIQSNMTNENDPDLGRDIVRVRKLVSAIKDLQELIDDVTLRDMQLALKRHIEWMAVHEATGSPVEVAQQHYDWCQDHL